MSRLILIAGADATGASALAHRTLEAAGDEGLRAVLVDGTRPYLDDDDDAGTSTVDSLTAALTRVLGEAGADPIAAADWVGLPSISALATLSAAVDALDEADVVVVDAGGLAQVRVLVETPVAVVRLLDSVLTPRLAMHRTSAGESVLFDAFSSARVDALRLVHALRRPDATVRLVTPAVEAVAHATQEALAVLALLGVAVDGIAVTGMPRSGDGASKQARRHAQALVDALEVDGVTVWSAGRRGRPAPKGRSPVAVLGAVPGLDDARLHVEVGDEELTVDIPLAHAARADVRVGLQGERLVVESARVRRWLDLPSVLRRCVAVRAERTSTGLRVVFVPDPATWRQTEEAS